MPRGGQSASLAVLITNPMTSCTDTVISTRNIYAEGIQGFLLSPLAGISTNNLVKQNYKHL